MIDSETITKNKITEIVKAVEKLATEGRQYKLGEKLLQATPTNTDAIKYESGARPAHPNTRDTDKPVYSIIYHPTRDEQASVTGPGGYQGYVALQKKMRNKRDELVTMGVPPNLVSKLFSQSEHIAENLGRIDQEAGKKWSGFSAMIDGIVGGGAQRAQNDAADQKIDALNDKNHKIRTKIKETLIPDMVSGIAETAAEKQKLGLAKAVLDGEWENAKAVYKKRKTPDGPLEDMSDAELKQAINREREEANRRRKPGEASIPPRFDETGKDVQMEGLEKEAQRLGITLSSTTSAVSGDPAIAVTVTSAAQAPDKAIHEKGLRQPNIDAGAVDPSSPVLAVNVPRDPSLSRETGRT